MPGINAPYEGRVKIRDSFLADAGNANSIIDLQKLTPAAAFEHYAKNPTTGIHGYAAPRGLSIEGQAAAAINCKYNNDPYFVAETFVPHITHRVRIRQIRVGATTTARGIIIKF